MLRKVYRLFVLILFCCTINSSILSQTPNAVGMADVSKVRSEVAARGEGKNVSVKLKDGSKLEGRISNILERSFDLTGKTKGQLSTIAYSDVEKVSGTGMSGGTKAVIILGVAAGVAAVVVGVAAKRGLSNMCPLGCGGYYQ